MTIRFPTLETRATATKDPGLCHCSKTCKKSTVHTCYKLSLCETGSFIIIATSPPFVRRSPRRREGEGDPTGVLPSPRLQSQPPWTSHVPGRAGRGGEGRGEERKRFNTRRVCVPPFRTADPFSRWSPLPLSSLRSLRI